MSASISSALSTASVAAANLSSNTARVPQRQTEQPPAGNAGYTVQLSEAQQVYQLYNQGQQIPQIAAALNLSESVIDNYLGITSGGN